LAGDVRSSAVEFGLDLRAEETDYSALTEYFQRMKSTVSAVLEAKAVAGEAFEPECIQFFDSLGDDLGTRADQSMRAPSLPCSSFASFLMAIEKSLVNRLRMHVAFELDSLRTGWRTCGTPTIHRQPREVHRKA